MLLFLVSLLSVTHGRGLPTDDIARHARILWNAVDGPPGKASAKLRKWEEHGYSVGDVRRIVNYRVDTLRVSGSAFQKALNVQLESPSVHGDELLRGMLRVGADLDRQDAGGEFPIEKALGAQNTDTFFLLLSFWLGTVDSNPYADQRIESALTSAGKDHRNGRNRVDIHNTLLRIVHEAEVGNINYVGIPHAKMQILRRVLASISVPRAGPAAPPPKYNRPMYHPQHQQLPQKKVVNVPQNDGAPLGKKRRRKDGKKRRSEKKKDASTNRALLLFGSGVVVVIIIVSVVAFCMCYK